MIIQELRADFNEYFQSPNSELVLWLDPSAQWKGVVEHLRKDFGLIEYNGSQLQIKAEIELTWAKNKRPKFVLYLPGLTRDALTVLKEYEFSGKVFEETILQSFRRWGVEFERDHETELERILPVLVTKYAMKSRSFWRERLTPENLRSLLFDDETIRKMLASAEITAKELRDYGVYEIFSDFVEDRLGGPKLRDTDPIEWVRRFTAYLILTEVQARCMGFLSPPKFDIKSADDRYEGRCLSFLRDWLKNATYKGDFKRISSEIEKKYDLSSWASGLSEFPMCESSLSVEKALENKILTRINNTNTLSELRSVLMVESQVIDQIAEHFWSREGSVLAWQALRLANQIIRTIDDCISELGKSDSPSLLACRYTDQWWKIDRDYRNYRAKYDGENRLGKLSQQIAAIYRQFQDQLNEKFLNMIQTQGTLTINGIEKQSSFWTRSVASSRRKRAVLLVDALRFELACDLKDRLEETIRDAQVKCTPLIASVPTLTPVGMASIVSGEEIEVDLTTDGNWNVKSIKKGEVGNLSVKEDRKNILKKRHPKAVFYNFEDILKPSELNVGDGNPVVLFTQEMDGLGHESGVLNLSLDYFGQYLDGLVRAIRRLSSVGIEEIHIISDHGFVILDEVTDSDKITIPKEVELLYKGHRCLVGKELPKELGVAMELPNSNSLRFCVPRGTGIFRARGGSQFFHGGISLQEFIIPQLEIVFAKAQPKYGVKVKAPDAIHNLIFEIDLLRAIPAGDVLFGAPRFVEIVGTLANGDKEVFRQSGPEMVINQENESPNVRLRIKPGIRFGYGDVLHLELKDADTGELLDGADIRIEVESNE